MSKSVRVSEWEWGERSEMRSKINACLLRRVRHIKIEINKIAR